MSFDEACYKDMVRKDPFAAFLFALERVPRGQRATFQKWWREAMSLKEKKAGQVPGEKEV